MQRRHFIAQGLVAASATALTGGRAAEKTPSSRPPCILLRGSWQSINIGDIGHTPGALELIERHLPGARVILWHGTLGHGSREFLSRRFPALRFVDASPDPRNRLVPAADADGWPKSPALRKAWEEADVMLHGSGSGFGARAHLRAWHRATGKPYGVFGTSTDPISGFGAGRDPEGGTLASLWARMEKLPATHLDAETRGIIDHAAFFFARDTLSLDYLKRQGVHPSVLEFGPDSQLGMTCRDDARADVFRREHGLEVGKYICVIPRSRYTPLEIINNRAPDDTDRVRRAISDRHRDADHAGIRELIVNYIRQTGHRVVTCPEVTYQVDLAKPALIDPLPDEIKKHVVWRRSYWLPDEAAALYAHALAVVSADCHSPLIALTHGTPTFYVRNPTDTCKGQMFSDFGLGDWLFEVESPGAHLWARLEAILAHPAKARVYREAAMARIHARQQRMIRTIAEALA